jgi:hypothetical protein
MDTGLPLSFALVSRIICSTVLDAVKAMAVLAGYSLT